MGQQEPEAVCLAFLNEEEYKHLHYIRARENYGSRVKDEVSE